MKRFLTLPALLLALGIAAPAAAQETADVTTELRALVSETASADADRAAIQSFIERDDVAAAAASKGIALDGVADRIETLDDRAAADLADRVRDVQEELDMVGGDTFVISSTAIIIGLLIVILIVVS